MTVHGNILVTGNLLKPSDKRLKENIQPASTKTSLQNITRLKLYDYDLKNPAKPGEARERGVLAQELQSILPMAVKQLDQVKIENGTTVQNVLVVNERMLLYENIGATQELYNHVLEDEGNVTKLGEKVNKLEGKQKKLN